MGSTSPWRVTPEGEFQLIALSAALILGSQLTLLLLPDPVIEELPEMIVPLGVSIALGLFSLKICHGNYDFQDFDRIAKCGWIGALISIGVSGWWIVVHAYSSMPFVGLPEQIATLVSLSTAGGVVVGYLQREKKQYSNPKIREQVIAERCWAEKSCADAILDAVVEVVAEVEGIDPTEVPPLYEKVDPVILSKLQSHEGAPWEVQIHFNEYVLSINSYGAVTIFEDSNLQNNPQIRP